MDHDSYTDDYISDILRSARTIAMIGASANVTRPSHGVLAFLKAHGYHMFPINPGLAGKTLLDLPVHAKLADLPDVVDIVDVFRNSAAIDGVVDEVLALPTRPKVVWMQLGVRNDAAAARAEAAGIKVVMDRCPKIEIQRLRL
jgi:predicted CoA-binding protein